MTCEMACCCFNCVGCKIAGIPTLPTKTKGQQGKQGQKMKVEMEAAGVAKDSSEPKDDDDDVITTTLGLANGVHFAFNYCLFCSVTPIQQAA